ncbi:MAG: phage major capsid protein [Paracoccaceae bacterium]
MSDHLDDGPIMAEGFGEDAAPEAASMEAPEEAPEEAKAAAAAFLDGFEGFKRDVVERLGAIGARVDRLDARAGAARRPALSAKAGAGPAERAAFGAFLRGHADGAPARKGLTAGDATSGGFLLDRELAVALDRGRGMAGGMRSICRVTPVEAGSYEVLVDKTDLEAGWIAETGPVGETAPPAFDKITIALHELSASPQASNRLLDDAAFDLEGWLAERIGERFRRAESAAFVSGDGVDRPKGFLHGFQVPRSGWNWGVLGYVATGAAGGFDLNDPADALIELVYTLGAEYRAGAAFVMNSKTAGDVRKMKDNQGRFLWSESLTEAAPARLLGYPVVIVEDMPDIAQDAMAIAFGDFMQGYTVVERPEVRILRDPYSARPNVSFYATKRVGGAVTDWRAIKLLKFAAS